MYDIFYGDQHLPDDSVTLQSLIPGDLYLAACHPDIEVEHLFGTEVILRQRTQ